MTADRRATEATDVRKALGIAGFSDIAITETHRVQTHAAAAIIRALKR